MYRVNQIKLNINHSELDFKNKIAKRINMIVDDIDWSTLIILHKSIDARDKKNILFVYNVVFDFVGASKTVGASIAGPKNKIHNKNLEEYKPTTFNPYIVSATNTKIQSSSNPRPIVVGFGPAGIFASYIFALNGLKPIIVERGKSIDDRIKDTEKFFNTMELDENSNVCFGEGGAGAFSDGKLNTNNKDRDGIYHFILETFVKYGADKKILYESMPHVGTDKLIDIIKNIRNEIIRLGGEIFYNTKLSFKNGIAVLTFIAADSQSFAPTVLFTPTIMKDTPVVLAIGNSSRDTFRALMKNGFDLKPKPFAIGYRIAHRQSMIDYSQYGLNLSEQENSHNSAEKETYGSELHKQQRNASVRGKLGSATYKLTYDVGNGHSVYSFCMCPGGYIINSSNYKGMLSINGMSYNDRGGKYANSAIVETVSPEDILGLQSSPLRDGTPIQAIKMIEFQEIIEKKAFELEKGFIPYVSNAVNDLCLEDVFKGQAKYSEKLTSVYEDLGLKFSINEDIEKALKHFNKVMPGFFGDISNTQYVLAGVETRTSSPVKLDRDENYMCNIKNYYPCGEGLGHGGGIISSAADGVRVASKIITTIYSG